MIPTVLPGGHSEPEPPESIPNSQVKTLTVRDLRWYAIRILSVERQSGFYPLWDRGSRPSFLPFKLKKPRLTMASRLSMSRLSATIWAFIIERTLQGPRSASIQWPGSGMNTPVRATPDSGCGKLAGGPPGLSTVGPENHTNAGKGLAANSANRSWNSGSTMRYRCFSLIVADSDVHRIALCRNARQKRNGWGKRVQRLRLYGHIKRRNRLVENDNKSTCPFPWYFPRHPN